MRTSMRMYVFFLAYYMHVSDARRSPLFIRDVLLLSCCFTAVLLLLYCCFTAALRRPSLASVYHIS
jgi:hypothetical protein